MKKLASRKKLQVEKIKIRKKIQVENVTVKIKEKLQVEKTSGKQRGHQNVKWHFIKNRKKSPCRNYSENYIWHIKYS